MAATTDKPSEHQPKPAESAKSSPAPTISATATATAPAPAPSATATATSAAATTAAGSASQSSEEKEMKAKAAAAASMAPITDKPEKPLVDQSIHVKAPALTPETEAKLKLLREELAKEKVYKDNAAMRYYCDPQMLHRYLRARGGNVAKAKEMLLASLEWRKEMRPELIRAPDMAVEGRTGKVIVGNTLDRWGRPIMFMDGSRENTKGSVDQLRFVAWSLHRTWMKMQNGVEKYVLFINLENYSFFNSPPIRTTLETVKTLVSRYPEHMGHCIMYRAPRLFSALWAMATPIIDAHMLSKVLFVQGDTTTGSRNDKILREIVGDNWKEICFVEGKEFEKTTPPGFDHAAFWPAVLSEDKGHGDRYTEMEAAWAKQDGRPVRDSSNVGIPPAGIPNVPADNHNKDKGATTPLTAVRTTSGPNATTGAVAAGTASPTSTMSAPAGGASSPVVLASPTTGSGAGAATLSPPAVSIPGLNSPSAIGAAPTANAQVVTLTPPTSQRSSGGASGSGAGAGLRASPSKPGSIDTSKATLEASPLPAPPMPNTPILIPPEALGSTPVSTLRALHSATPPIPAPASNPHVPSASASASAAAAAPAPVAAPTSQSGK